MNNTEDILVISSLVLLATLAVANAFSYPAQIFNMFRRSTILPSFDKSRLKRYVLWVLAAIIISAVYNALIARNMELFIQATILNTIIITVGLFAPITYVMRK